MRVVLPATEYTGWKNDSGAAGNRVHGVEKLDWCCRQQSTRGGIMTVVLPATEYTGWNNESGAAVNRVHGVE